MKRNPGEQATVMLVPKLPMNRQRPSSGTVLPGWFTVTRNDELVCAA